MTAEAGWYTDPERPDELRWWDGESWTEHRAHRTVPPAEEAEPEGREPRPSPRLIRNPHDAEEAAAEWLRWFGFTDAEATHVGADGGVDVRGRSMVAQVKAHMVPIGRPDLQRLYGVAQVERAAPMFFSLMHYTRDAQEWAEQVGMALFRFDHAGEPEPVNSSAVALVERAEHQSLRPREPERPWSAIPLGCSDEAACQALTPTRGSFTQRQTDRVLWVRQGWLPVGTVRYDFTYVATRSGRGEQFLYQGMQRVPYVPSRGPRAEELFAQSGAAIELVKGYAVGVRPSGPMIQVPPEYVNLRPRANLDRVVEVVEDLWDTSASDSVTRGAGR